MNSTGNFIAVMQLLIWVIAFTGIGIYINKRAKERKKEKEEK